MSFIIQMTGSMIDVFRLMGHYCPAVRDIYIFLHKIRHKVCILRTLNKYLTQKLSRFALSLIKASQPCVPRMNSNNRSDQES